MNDLQTIEMLASKIPCPICLNSRFEINLNCELPHSPCEYNAVCGHCHHKIVITQTSKTMEDVWERVEKTILEKGCPKCQDQKLTLEFLCDLHSEDCFFLVRCKENGHYSRIDQKGIMYLFQ